MITNTEKLERVEAGNICELDWLLVALPPSPSIFSVPARVVEWTEADFCSLPDTRSCSVLN